MNNRGHGGEQRGPGSWRTATRLGRRERSRETRKERVDRELIELLNELRVALPGVQILFAFLLIVLFQQTATGSPTSSGTSTS